MATLFLNACVDDYQIGPSINSDLSVEDAKALYESCLSSAITKSDDGNAQPNYIRTEDEHSAYTEKDFPDKEEFRDFDLMEEIFAKCDFETSLKPVSMK